MRKIKIRLEKTSFIYLYKLFQTLPLLAFPDQLARFEYLTLSDPQK